MLELHDVSVRFGGIQALKRVTLTVGDRETVGLVGPNGAGKTTLFNAMSGAVRLSSGDILFCGERIHGLSQHRRAKAGIGRTFQVPRPLHELTVRQNVTVAQYFGSRRKKDAIRVDQILEAVGLTDRQHEDASSGLTLVERKALEVGKALATDPKLLLLDEAFAGLETHSKRHFAKTISRIRTDFSLAVLVIEHDIDTIRSLCDRVAVLNFGELIAEGTADEVFNDPEVIRSYTGDAAA